MGVALDSIGGRLGLADGSSLSPSLAVVGGGVADLADATLFEVLASEVAAEIFLFGGR